MRVELISRESNLKAISLYESLGFTREGKLDRRIRNNKNELEADIPMAWFNPNFKKANLSRDMLTFVSGAFAIIKLL